MRARREAKRSKVEPRMAVPIRSDSTSFGGPEAPKHRISSIPITKRFSPRPSLYFPALESEHIYMRRNHYGN